MHAWNLFCILWGSVASVVKVNEPGNKTVINNRETKKHVFPLHEFLQNYKQKSTNEVFRFAW